MTVNAVPWDEYEKSQQASVNAVPWEDHVKHSEAKEASHVLDDPLIDFGEQFGKGAYNSFADLANYLIADPVIYGTNKVAQALGHKGDLVDYNPIPKSHTPARTMAGSIGNFGGEVAALLAPGLPAKAGVTVAHEALEHLPVINRMLSLFAGKGIGAGLRRRAAGSTIEGAATNPDNRAQGAGLGLLSSMVLDAPPEVGKLGLSKLAVNAEKQGKSPLEQVQETIEADPDRTLTIRDITQASPEQENTTRDASRSFTKIMNRVHQSLAHLHGTAHGVLENYRNNLIPGEIKDFIHNRVLDTANRAIAKNSKMYQDAALLAEKNGVKFRAPKLKESAKKYLSEIKAGGLHPLEKETSMLKNVINDKSIKFKGERDSIGKLPDDVIYQDMLAPNYKQKLLDEVQGKQDEAEKFNYNSISNTLSELSDRVNAAAKQGKNSKSHALSQLLDAAKKDIENEAEGAGPEVGQRLSAARKDFAENVVPFKTGTAKPAHNDLHQHLSASSRADNGLSSLLMQDGYADLLPKLDDDTRKAIVYDLASQHRAAINRISPDYAKQFERLPNNLSDFFNNLQTKKSEAYKDLVKPHEHKEIVNLQRLNAANAENKVAYKKPPTGFRGEANRAGLKDLVGTGILGTLAHSAGMSAIPAYALGAGAIIGKGYFKDARDRFLRSDKARDMLVRHMKGESDLINTPRLDRAKRVLQSMALAALAEDN